MNQQLTVTLRDVILAIAGGSIVNLRGFPNPTDNDHTVKFHLKQSRQITISPYDLAGQQVIDFKTDFYSAGDVTEHIQLNNIVKGIYMLVVKSDNNEITMHRIIKK